MFTWVNAYSVGIEEIDNQHKTLIDILNKVAKNQETLFESEGKMKKIVHEIKTFAILHFSTEKRYMEKFNYPSILEHIKEHDFFIETINLIETGLSSVQPNAPMDLLLVLKKWFVNHLTNTDQKFYTFMKKVAPEELKMLGI